MPPAALRASRPPIRGLRWAIVGLLFVATTINYVDRVTMSALSPLLKTEIHWDDAEFGLILSAFQLAYTAMFAVVGPLLDRFGVRLGMTLGVIVWSLAAAGHALARTPVGFGVARFALGLGEATNMPACVKAVSEWFPRRERALATGIFNAGTNLGAMAQPLIVLLAVTAGWQSAFLLTAALGLLWLGGWLALYRAPREHARLGVDERALIESDAESPITVRVPWTALLRVRQAWAFFLGKMLTDPVWWFYLYWLNYYWSKEHGVSAAVAAKLILTPYIAASVGSLFGGWLSGQLMKRGMSVGQARLRAMAIFALGMPAVIGTLLTHSLAASVVLLSIATACHQAWSANLFTTASDLFPKSVVGSVVGFGSMCGGIGGFFMTLVSGGMLQWFGSFTPLLLIAGLMHVTAWVIVRVLTGPSYASADLARAMSGERSARLVGAGLAVTLAGVAASVLVLANWQWIATSAKSSATAMSGLGAGIGLLALGLAILYAGTRRHTPFAALSDVAEVAS